MTCQSLMCESMYSLQPASGSHCLTNSSNSFDLPDDVFQPGETRPTRPKKKVIKKTEATAQKRTIEALDVSICNKRPKLIFSEKIHN